MPVISGKTEKMVSSSLEALPLKSLETNPPKNLNTMTGKLTANSEVAKPIVPKGARTKK